MKPGAPAEIRGPFRPIATNVPGIEICEHLPRLARQADKLALVRSVTYPNNDHPYMIYYTLTGRVSPAPLGANTVLPPSRSDHPHAGAVVAKLRHRADAVPGYVAIPEVQIRMQAVPVSGGGRAGYLGAAHDPFAINGDPRAEHLGLELAADITARRFDQRQGLLAMIEGDRVPTRPAGEYVAQRSNAQRLVGGAAARGLFSLDREPAALRERYGTHRFGQSLLLARRLVERGVTFVAVHFNHMTKCDGWDTHQKNFDALSGELLPLLDQGLAALLEDLEERGLLDETLVLTMGEFGRSPRINADGGRDHWGNCASVLFAGGGTRGGQVIGASDPRAAYPTDAPVTPPDVLASLYAALGVPRHAVLWDEFQGRPLSVCDGKPIAGLLGARGA